MGEIEATTSESPGRGKVPEIMVMSWPARANENDNQYVQLLAKSLRDVSVVLLDFGWATSLFTRYELLHVHWPDWTIRDSGTIRSLVKLGLLTLVMVRNRILNVPVVWTVHNLHAHNSTPGRRDRYLYRLLALTVTTQIHLTAGTEEAMAAERHPARGHRHVVVPHGLYPVAEEYTRRPGSVISDSSNITFGLVGTLSPYKGVEDLIDAFIPMSQTSTLSIAGAVSDTAYERELRQRVKDVSNVHLKTNRLTEDEYCRVLAKIDVAVFPLVSGLNSGSVLRSLGQGVPVLVPRTPTFISLQHSFPHPWIQMYDGQLTTRALIYAREQLQSVPIVQPRLNGWSWAEIAMSTRGVYEDAQLSGRLK